MNYARYISIPRDSNTLLTAAEIPVSQSTNVP